MKIHKYIFILGLGLFVSSVYAQRQKINQAVESYENLEYSNTSKLLLEVVNNGGKSVDIYQKLANSFYFNKNMDAAANWYEKMLDLDANNVDSETYFRFAQALKSIEKYKKSDKMMHAFHKLNADDSRGKLFATDLDYLNRINNLSSDFEVSNLKSNSETSDFGSTIYKNQLIFSSARGKGKVYQWNNQSFLDLYTITRQNDGSFGEQAKLFEEVNSKYHESTVSFTPDGKTMYFTRNNFFEGKFKKDKQGVHRLKIFKATLKNGKWDDIESLPFNSKNYSVAHPSVNSDDTKLYFASDMPGTLGESDIYMVDIHSDGTYGEPINLGALVNTEGQESFPYINAEGDLFFSSNGLVGLGGLDVFVIRDFQNQESIVENVGKPINSSQDDFGYYENIALEEGFFTSNRNGGKGNDDIYSFKPKQTLFVEIAAVDLETGELVSPSSLVLFDDQGTHLEKEFKIGPTGNYIVELDQNKKYLIQGTKEGYIPAEVTFTVPKKEEKENFKVEFLFEKEEIEIEEGLDIAAALDILTINFDLDKSNIRPDAAIELDKIIEVLNSYPKIKIAIKSHTDSRASSAYNNKLSERRAQATLNYFIKIGGINSDRLTAKGFGESQLLNKCSNGVKCSKQDHEANRRSEFIIIEK